MRTMGFQPEGGVRERGARRGAGRSLEKVGGAQKGAVGSSIAGVLIAIFALCCALVMIRWCRRRRFYKKVQRTMDEEELAFQKSLAKNYTEEMAELDDSERERLKLLENYMETMGASLGAEDEKDEANLENVEAFLDQLSKAAAAADGEAGSSAADDLEAHGSRPVQWKEVTR